ncbi:MAG: 30S ribosomal protein S16 [Acidobacteriota bacterium]
MRLTRKGKKNQPFFRIVVIDKKRSSTDGRAVEELGYVNPLTEKNSCFMGRPIVSSKSRMISLTSKPSTLVRNLTIFPSRPISSNSAREPMVRSSCVNSLDGGAPVFPASDGRSA